MKLERFAQQLNLWLSEWRDEVETATFKAIEPSKTSQEWFQHFIVWLVQKGYIKNDEGTEQVPGPSPKS